MLNVGRGRSNRGTVKPVAKVATPKPFNLPSMSSEEITTAAAAKDAKPARKLVGSVWGGNSAEALDPNRTPGTTPPPSPPSEPAPAWGAAAAPAWGKGAPAAKGATYGGKPAAAAQWAPPQKDPPPWAQAEGEQGELLWKAVPEAVAGFAHLEPDATKLEKKIRDYFNKASKNINFRGRTLQECVDEYTDNAMGSLFASMGDREWLYKGQADFVLLLDAGIKDSFPGALLWTAEQHEFEQMVLTSYERAFDDNRFGPVLSETVKDKIQGPKSKKKVWNALDAGRKLVVAEGTTGLEEFVSTWIGRSLDLLAQAAGGNPADVMSSAQATELFQALLDGGTLPLAITAEHGEPPSPMPLVDETIQAVYAPLEAAAAMAEAEAEEARAAKRPKFS